MFGDLLRPAHMRHHLGDGFQDDLQVADRDTLGKQRLQHRLQARVGNLRRADFLKQPLVLGLEPVEQDPRVLVGEELRQVVADDLADVRQHHRQVVDGREALAAHLGGERLEDPHRLHAESRLLHRLAGNVRRRPSPVTTSNSPMRISCVAMFVP